MVKYWYRSKIDVAYAADESFPKDQWCIPQDVRRKSYYKISQQPRSTSSVRKLLRPSVALVSTAGTSYRKTIMTQPQTRNWNRINRRADQQGSCAGVTVLTPNFDKFVTEWNRRQLLKCKRTINPSAFNGCTLESWNRCQNLLL